MASLRVRGEGGAATPAGCRGGWERRSAWTARRPRRSRPGRRRRLLAAVAAVVGDERDGPGAAACPLRPSRRRPSGSGGRGEPGRRRRGRGQYSSATSSTRSGSPARWSQRSGSGVPSRTRLVAEEVARRDRARANARGARAPSLVAAEAAQQRHLEAARAHRFGRLLDHDRTRREGRHEIARPRVEPGQLEPRRGAERRQDLSAVPRPCAPSVVARARVGEAQVVLDLGVVAHAGRAGARRDDRVVGALQGRRPAGPPPSGGRGSRGSAEAEPVGLGGDQQLAVPLLGVAEPRRSRRRCAGRAAARTDAAAVPGGSPTRGVVPGVLGVGQEKPAPPSQRPQRCSAAPAGRPALRADERLRGRQVERLLVHDARSVLDAQATAAHGAVHVDAHRQVDGPDLAGPRARGARRLPGWRA